MKRYILPIMLAISAHISVAVHAQTPEPFDPTQIFYEGVQYSLIESETPSEPVQIDYEHRVIRLIDSPADAPREYPFPANVSSISTATLQSDGTILLDLFYEVGATADRFDVLLLDPETGLYEQPPKVCNDKVLQSKPGEGFWTVAYLGDNYEEPFLCFTENGEQRDALPAGGTYWRVFPSPDENWLVMITGIMGFGVFSYHIDANELTYLGTLSGDTDTEISICDWVTDTQGLICKSDRYRYWPGSGYYSFDVTQAESLAFAFGGWREDIFRIDDPLRYVNLYSQQYSATITGGENPDYPPCTLNIFDSSGLRQEELAYECIPMMIDSDVRSPYYRQRNIIYFLTTESADATFSTLHSYDVELEIGNNQLYSGEIESVLSVSPDGRYIVLLLDDDGELNFPWQFTPCCFDGGGWRVAILHQESHQIVYISEPIGVYAMNQVVWLDDSTVVIASTQEYEHIRANDLGDVWIVPSQPSLRRIAFGNTGVDVSITTQYGLTRGFVSLNVSPAGNYWLTDDNAVIDLRTFEQVPILRDDIPAEYSIFDYWLDDGDLAIGVDVSAESSESFIYRVNLP